MTRRQQEDGQRFRWRTLNMYCYASALFPKLQIFWKIQHVHFVQDIFSLDEYKASYMP